MSLLNVKHSGPSVGHLDSRYVNVTGDTMTGGLTINTNSTTALLVERDGVKDNVLVVDTTNGRVGVKGTPSESFHIVGGKLLMDNNYSINMKDASGSARTMLYVDGNSFARYGSTGLVDCYFDAGGISGAIIIKGTTGRVSIGAGASPSAKLHIKGSQDVIQQIVQANATQTANLQEWQNSSGTVLSYIRGDGRLAIDVNNTATSGVVQAAFLRISPQPTADTSATYQGFSGQITGTYNFNATGYIAGVHGSIYASPAVGKTITWASGVQSRVNNAGAGTITNAALFRGEQLQDGLFTNAYGLYLPSIAAGATLNYAIFTNAGLNRLGDQLSIVGSADRIQLSVKANATQTANLLELLPNASSTPLAYFSSVGSLRIQTATTVLATLINTEPSGSSTGAYINLYERDGAPLVSGDRLGGFIMGGSRNISNTTNNSVAFNSYAIETWSDTQAGARCTFEVCPSGSINRTVIAGIYGNGLVLGTTTSAPTGLLQLNGIADATQLIVKANATQTTNLQEWQNSSATVLSAINGVGNWGIGIAPGALYKLNISNTHTDPLEGSAGLNLTENIILTADNANQSYGLKFYIGTSGGSNFTASLYGIQGFLFHAGTGTLANGFGSFAGTRVNGFGTITNAYGYVARNGTQTSSTGNIENSYQFFANSVVANGSGIITNWYGFYAANQGNAKISNSYGIYLDNQSGSTTFNYAIFTNAGLNELNDQLFVDGSADRVQLKVQAHSTQTSNLVNFENSSGTVQLAIAGNGRDFILDATTGSKIGTATSQKLGFWNAAPIVQPTTGVTAATIVGGAGTTVKEDHTFDGYTIAQVVKALRNAGLLA